MKEITFEVDNTALQTVSGLVINANWDEMKKSLSELVEPYKSVIVTEDAIADAKGTRARLNKLKGNIDDYRKTVKKLYSAPLTAFENKCKELTGICDEGISNLDKQVKEFEAERQKKKDEHLREVYSGIIGENSEYLPYEKIFNQRWLNVTYAEEDIVSEMTAAAEKVANEVEVVSSLSEVYKEVLLRKYKQTLNLAEVVRLNNEIAAADKRAEEAQREKERAAEEAEMKRRYDELQKNIKEAEERPAATEAPEEELAQWITLSVCIKPSQYAGLVELLNSKGIEFKVG